MGRTPTRHRVLASTETERLESLIPCKNLWLFGSICKRGGYMFFHRTNVLPAVLLLCVGCAPVKHVPVVVPAALVTRTALSYPPLAIREHHQGTVVLLMLVGTKGTPLTTWVSKSSGFRELDRAAIQGTQHWIYRPETIDGMPTESYVRTPVNFFLNGLKPTVSPQPNRAPSPTFGRVSSSPALLRQ